MSDETTARLALPLLAPGQAQKEMTHNEALALLDVAVQACVLSIGLNDPPDAPAPGECWIVGEAPAGAWSDAAKALAEWTAGGWRFVPPTEGMMVWISGEGVNARFTGGAWRVGVVTAQQFEIGGVQVVGAQAAAIADPAGGATIDTEARTAIAAILAALRGHGLIGTG